MSNSSPLKPILWVSSSKDDLMDMPEEVRKDFGYGLHQAQMGLHPDSAEPLSGFGSARILALKLKEQGESSRAIYTVQFKEAIIVLHVFQKKSKSGIGTPKKDMDLIYSRLKLAEGVYDDWKKSKNTKQKK